VPQLVNRNTDAETVSFMFRPSGKFRDVTVRAAMGDADIAAKKLVAVTPGEMIKLDIPVSAFAADCDEIEISLEGGAI
jgi:hypothetical protein